MSNTAYKEMMAKYQALANNKDPEASTEVRRLLNDWRTSGAKNALMRTAYEAIASHVCETYGVLDAVEGFRVSVWGVADAEQDEKLGNKALRLESLKITNQNQPVADIIGNWLIRQPTETTMSVENFLKQHPEFDSLMKKHQSLDLNVKAALTACIK